MSYAPPPPPPPGAGGYAQPQTNQKAVWSLVLGIVGLVCCGLVAGIPAIVLGNMAKNEIAASGGAQGGAGMAKAGLILGIVATAFSVVSGILFATGMVDFGSFNTTP